MLSTPTTLLDGDEILEALKECEYALKAAIRNDKIGWLQQVAHKTACDALNKRLAAMKSKPSNLKLSYEASKPDEDSGSISPDEARRVESEMEALQIKVCAQVEAAAASGRTTVDLSVDDLRQILYVLAIRPFRVKNMKEVYAELKRALA